MAPLQSGSHFCAQRSIRLLFCRSRACATENLQNSHKETAIPTFLAGGIVIECIRKIMRLPQSCNFAQTQAAPLVPPPQGAVSEADWGLYRRAVLPFKRSSCKLAATPSLRCASAAPCKGGTRGFLPFPIRPRSGHLHFAFCIYHVSFYLIPCACTRRPGAGRPTDCACTRTEVCHA